MREYHYHHYQGKELTRNSSGNALPQSCPLSEPLWTDLWSNSVRLLVVSHMLTFPMPIVSGVETKSLTDRLSLEYRTIHSSTTADKRNSFVLVVLLVVFFCFVFVSPTLRDISVSPLFSL